MQPHICVALKNPTYAEEVRSAAANEIRKKYLVPEVIWVELYDEVEMRRSFLSRVAEENFGVLNVSGWKPAADILLIYCQDRDHNICIHKRLMWEPRSVNVIHQPFHWACLSISLSSTAGNDLCLSVNDPSVSLCLIVLWFLFSTIVSELKPPQACRPWNDQLLLWCPVFYFCCS